MADIAAVTALKVTLYRNGDENFPGKTKYVNPIKVRNMDQLRDELQKHVNCNSAVRRIFSRNGRNRVTSVAQLQHGGEYVLVGRGCYKKCRYGGIPNRKSNVPKFPRLGEAIKNRWMVPGRVREVYESEKSGLRKVQIHHNGDERNLPHKVLLHKATMNNMEQVLSFIQTKIQFDVALDSLYSLEGKKIVETSDIVNFGAYVAVERGRKFKCIPYKGSESYFLSHRSAPVPHHPYPLSKKSQKIRSYPNSKNSIQEVPTSEDEGPGDQSRVTSTTLDMSSPFDVTPTPHDTKRLEETVKEQKSKQVVAISSHMKQTRSPQAEEKFLVKAKQELKNEKERILPIAPPERKGEENGARQETKVKSKSQLPPSKPKMVRGKVKSVKGMHNRPRALPRAELKPQQQPQLDNKETVSVDVFKASGLQREKGQQVVETRDVVSDIPIDMLPAEEIVEELPIEVTQEVEDIDIDPDNKVRFSEEESEAKRSPVGSSRNSSARSSLGHPTSVWSPSEDNKGNSVVGAVSIIQNLKNEIDKEEREDENEGKTANSQSHVDREESVSSTALDEIQSATLKSEEDEKVDGEEDATSEQTNENQAAETNNHKSNTENDSSEELQHIKDEERDGDKNNEKVEVSAEDESYNDVSLTDAIDAEAKSSNSEEPSAKGMAGKDEDHEVGSSSGVTEQETNNLNVDTSEKKERDSYFS